jgi:hypothetical protein
VGIVVEGWISRPAKVKGEGRDRRRIRLCLLEINENAFQFIYRNHKVFYIDHYLGDLAQVLESVDLVTYILRDMRDQKAIQGLCIAQAS